jgi:pimeloyl-ACP methyl ester carboxylesterase
MEYTQTYFELKKQFARTEDKFAIDEEIGVINLPFNSENHWQCILDESKTNLNSQLEVKGSDSLFFENNHFTYPVFVPLSRQRHNKAIVLLHGLNERFWDKYLPWAYFLAKHTQRPVILFPIAFHMNRSPKEWNNPRAMAPLVNNRKQQFNTHTLTFANAALSVRLTEDPLRFLMSGHQTAEDLVQLIKQIKQGLIPLFEKETTIDIFAYSIGAFVAQIMMVAFPKGLFSDSKFFLFCGGAFFEDMNGISRLIMDKIAFDNISKYYLTDIRDAMTDNKLLGSLLTEFPLGKAFFAMLSEWNNPLFRETELGKVTNHIYAVSLKKDTVIPALGINKFFSLARENYLTFETLDFPYEYGHETPFPISGKTDASQVDRCFNELFSKAAGFLA